MVLRIKASIPNGWGLFAGAGGFRGKTLKNCPFNKAFAFGADFG